MKNFVVTITRRAGSGGIPIGELIAEHYGINLYDKKILQMASEESGISEQLFAGADETQKKSLLYKVSKKIYSGKLMDPTSSEFTSQENLFAYQAKVFKELAEKESYVVVGRAADYVLKDCANVISIYIHAPRENCIKGEMARQGISRQEAVHYVETMDEYREVYYTHHTGHEWRDAHNYDLVLDTSKYTYEQAAKLVIAYIDALLGFGEE